MTNVFLVVEVSYIEDYWEVERVIGIFDSEKQAEIVKRNRQTNAVEFEFKVKPMQLNETIA